jgi:hypothetical protein
MIIERHRDLARRIGTVTISGNSFDRLPKTRESIRLE